MHTFENLNIVLTRMHADANADRDRCRRQQLGDNIGS